MGPIDPINPEVSLRLHVAQLRETIETERLATSAKCVRIAALELSIDEEKRRCADAWIDFRDRTFVLEREIEFTTQLLIRTMPAPPMIVLAGNPTAHESVFAKCFSQKG